MVYEKKKPGRKRKLLESFEIPLIPEGETEQTVNEQHSQLIAFCKTNKQDVMLVRQLMDGTFPKRRKTILEDNERVWKTLKDYPPLTRGNGSEVRKQQQQSITHLLKMAAMRLSKCQSKISTLVGLEITKF